MSILYYAFTSGCNISEIQIIQSLVNGLTLISKRGQIWLI